MTNTLTIDKTITVTGDKATAAVLWIGAGALLTAVGAQITIPLLPVPFTLQTLFVLLSGAFLGARKGAAAQVAYLAAGAAGLPVFAGFSGTALHLLGPTGGYLLAFPGAAFLAGWFIHDAKIVSALPLYARTLSAMTLAMLLIFTSGVVYLNMVFVHNWQASIHAGFAVMQVWDAVKLFAAAGIFVAATKGLQK
jgi:biotin transport system substrate-specific component